MPIFPVGDKMAAVRHNRVFAVAAAGDINSAYDLMIAVLNASGILFTLVLPDDTSSLCQQLEERRAELQQDDIESLYDLVQKACEHIFYARDVAYLGTWLQRVRTAWSDIQGSLVYADFPHTDVAPALAAFPLIAQKPLDLSDDLYSAFYRHQTAASFFRAHDYRAFLESIDYYLQFADPLRDLRSALEDGLQAVRTWHGFSQRR